MGTLKQSGCQMKLQLCLWSYCKGSKCVDRLSGYSFFTVVTESSLNEIFAKQGLPVCNNICINQSCPKLNILEN